MHAAQENPKQRGRKVHRNRIRLFSFAVLVLVFLHMCGASGQVVNPGMVTWNFGPCSLHRPIRSSAMTIACYQHDVVRLWPPPGVQASTVH